MVDEALQNHDVMGACVLQPHVFKAKLGELAGRLDPLISTYVNKAKEREKKMTMVTEEVGAYLHNMFDHIINSDSMMEAKVAYKKRQQQLEDSVVLGRFSKLQLVGYRNAFELFDKNKNEEVSVSELQSVMGTLGHPYTMQEAKKRVDLFDRDGNGTLDFSEFLMMMTATNSTYDLRDINMSAEQIAGFRQAFQNFDKDGGGTIDVSELGNVYRDLGMNPSKETIDKLLLQYDADGNGEIDFEEFLEMMGPARGGAVGDVKDHLKELEMDMLIQNDDEDDFDFDGDSDDLDG